jgi:hypothetical protein
MSFEERVWRIVGVLVALATMAIPLSITVEHFEQGEIPEKHVELQMIGPLDPLADLSALAVGTSLKLVVGQSTYSNVVIWHLKLSNRGKSPIKPSDFFENLRISVKPEWQIIGVGDRHVLSCPIRLKWRRMQATTMEADPFLFNPGDDIAQTIYITSSTRGKPPDSATSQPEVSARITNLKGFDQIKSFWEQPHKQAWVYLSLRDVSFLILVACLFLYWYLQLLARNKLLAFSNLIDNILILLAAALSYATAEVVIYYVSGGEPISEQLLGRHLFEWRYQIQNWAILLIHGTASLYLYIRGKRLAETK